MKNESHVTKLVAELVADGGNLTQLATQKNNIDKKKKKGTNLRIQWFYARNCKHLQLEPNNGFALIIIIIMELDFKPNSFLFVKNKQFHVWFSVLISIHVIYLRIDGRFRFFFFNNLLLSERAYIDVIRANLWYLLCSSFRLFSKKK